MTDQRELSDYLFGELEPDRREHLQSRIDRDPELRARVDELRALTERLDDLPQAAWAYVGERTEEPSPRLGTAARRRWGWGLARPRLAFAGFAGAAALAAVVIALLSAGSPSAQRSTVVLRALAGAPPNSLARATIIGSRQISVSVLHLPPTDAHHHYELWLMTSTTDLVPVGSFHVDGSGNVQMSAALPTAASHYRFLDISLQRDGAGAGISSQSLLRGPTASS
jgi:anti-sigma-K factor RskA